MLLIIPAIALLGACTPAQQKAWHDAMIRSSAASEDSAGWKCSLQGNGVCGPVSIEKSPMIVHAANGDFYYKRLETGKMPDGGTYYCAWGNSPNKGQYTMLACSDHIFL